MNKISKIIIIGTVVVLFWGMVGAIFAMGFCEVYHLVMPVKWHWLTREKINLIESMLMVGAITHFWCNRD